ncbi:MAG: HNH endonuclease signature motif containing protein, partial [Acidimicrobiales bacterium]
AHERLLAAALEVAAGGLDGDDLEPLVGLVRQVERDCVGLLVAVARIAEARAVDGQGAPVEDVLADRDSVTAARAAGDVARARVAGRFPVLADSIRAGEARPDNVDVLARMCDRMTPAEVDVLTSSDKVIAAAAERLGADSFRRKIHRLRDRIRADHGHTAAQQAAAETMARVWPSRDNHTYRLSAVFDVLQGAAVRQARSHQKRVLAEQLGPGHGLSTDQVAAQALADLVVRGANTEPTHHNTQPIVHLNVLTDGRTLSAGPHPDTIAETTDGLPVTPGTIGRLACDCVIRRVDTLADGNVNVSRSSRTATSAQRAALRARYPGCAISGAPWSQVEIHHLVFREHGGHTVLENLIPISRRWHHLIHDNGWQLQMHTDRSLRLTRPDGTLHRNIPPPTNVLTQHDTTLAA